MHASSRSRFRGSATNSSSARARRAAPRASTLAGCAAGLVLLASTARALDRAFVLSTDYETGYYSSLDLVPPWNHTNEIGSVCADAAARVHGDRIYVLGRFGCDHVQVLDAATLATLRQFSTGNGTNPQDIEVFAPHKAYVSLYDRDYLLIVDPENGQQLGSISLAAFSDADGLPEAAEMALVGDRLFVCLQRLDRPGGFVAANPSFVAVVDCNTDALVDVDPSTPGVQGIALTGRNPFSELVLDPVRQKLYVAEAGNFGVLDGGAEFIDPVSLRAEGFFVTEAQLGGDLNAVRLWVDCGGWAIANDASYRTKLVRFDRCLGGAPAAWWQSAGFDLCDLEIDRHGVILISDRDLQRPGVRLFQAGQTPVQITTDPIPFGLPPCDLAPLAPTLPADASSARAKALRLLPNWPDPFNPSTLLRVEAPPGTRCRLDIVDVRGRRVRALWDGPLPDAGRDFLWDGRDARGAALPSGVYVARLRAGAEVHSDRLVLVR